MQSTTTAKKTGTPAWVKVGIATRQYQALRLEVLIGPARGVYYISAADVTRAADESVQVYRLRTVQGEQLPEPCGFTYTSQNGHMVIVQIEAPNLARVMLPALQLLSHLKPSAANKPTTITAPREEVYSTPSTIQAVPA